jgi:TonB family protein
MAEGKVRDVKVIKSLDPGLDKQALAAVRTWKFEPATKDGKAVAVHLKAEVAFKLY